MTQELKDDSEIFIRMQAMCLEGQTIEEICKFIWRTVGAEPGDTMTAIRYFWKGFGLSLRDAKWIEASPICGGNAISLVELEDILRPKMLNNCNQTRPEH